MTAYPPVPKVATGRFGIGDGDCTCQWSLTATSGREGKVLAMPPGRRGGSPTRTVAGGSIFSGPRTPERIIR